MKKNPEGLKEHLSSSDNENESFIYLGATMVNNVNTSGVVPPEAQVKTPVAKAQSKASQENVEVKKVEDVLCVGFCQIRACIDEFTGDRQELPIFELCVYVCVCARVCV